MSDVDRMRGLLTGLVLGDALGAGDAGTENLARIRIGVTGQLACFTVDTPIRAHCREQDEGTGADRNLLAWLNHDAGPGSSACRWPARSRRCT